MRTMWSLGSFDTTVFFQLFNAQINTTHKNRNWAGSIKDCLESHGFHDVWTDGRVENEKAFLSAFKKRMIECFKQEWFAKISESERFSTYFSFKTVH